LTRTAFCIAGAACILAVNLAAFRYSDEIPNRYRRRDVTGLAYPSASRFVYFYYYLHLFPLTSSSEKIYSAAGARSLLEKEGHTLRMEYNHWTRLGEHGRIWCFLPDAWLRGGPRWPSVRIFNAITFTTGLLSVFLLWSLCGCGLAGFVLTLSVLANPYFLYEAYRNVNLFSLMPSACLFGLGLHAPLFFSGGQKGKFWMIPVIAGLMLGICAEIRTESLAIAAGCLAAYLYSGRPWKTRILWMMLLLSAIGLTRFAVRRYFDCCWKKTRAVCVKYGGIPYDSGRAPSHLFWHPVFCGLGDFGREKGYAWDDRVAYRYALPILNERYGFDLKYREGYALDMPADSMGAYYAKMDVVPHYESVVREKILKDVGGDPLWYLGILLRRILRMLIHTAPLPCMGFLSAPFIWLAWKRRDRPAVQVFLFSLAASLSSFLIYSKDNSTYGALYPLTALSFLLAWMFEKGRPSKR
jgi:hypothetical protein